MPLDTPQLLTVAGREDAIVTYSDEMVRQDMKRQKIEKLVDVHGHDSVLARFLVHFVVVGDSPIDNIKYSGIGDGHTVGISSDVFEYLADSFGRWFGMDNPRFVEALLADVFGEGNSLLIQPAGQQIHKTPTELIAHSCHGKEERCTCASMNLMPYSLCINASTRHDAVNMGVVKKIRSPRMENGSHSCMQSFIASKCINGSPCSLEHTVVELPLVSHRDSMQTVGQREYDMEISGRDDFFPAEFNPLLTLLVLAFGTMTVTAAVVADSNVSTFGTHLYMPSKGTGTALRHVPEGSFNRRHDMMLAKELSTVAPDDFTDVEARPHLDLGGKIVSINRTCFIGSISAT